MFTNISESEFNKCDPAFRLIDHDYPRAFGALRLPDAPHVLTISWRSDRVAPTVEFDSRSTATWVGVDQRVACVAPRGNILLSLALRTPLLQIKHLADYTVVLCETEALVFNDDYSLRRICDLPEIADVVTASPGQLRIKLIDGEEKLFSV